MCVHVCMYICMYVYMSVCVFDISSQMPEPIVLKILGGAQRTTGLV